jgi:hypothetical protein
MFDEFDDWDSRVGFVGTKRFRVQKFEYAKLAGFLLAMTDRLDDDVSIFAKTLQYQLHIHSELRALTYHGHPRLLPSED